MASFIYGPFAPGETDERLESPPRAWISTQYSPARQPADNRACARQEARGFLRADQARSTKADARGRECARKSSRARTKGRPPKRGFSDWRGCLRSRADR